MYRKMMITMALTAALFMSATAHAQRGGGQRLSPDELAAVWTTQAEGVADQAGLDAEATATVVTAYKESRARHQAAMDELRESGDRGPAAFQAYREASDTERNKLKETLSSGLTDEQVAAVIGPLGTYSRQWDRYTHIVSGLDLEGVDEAKAHALIAASVAESEKAREEAMANGDFESVRSAMQASKSKLDGELKSVLNEEQFSKWEEATAWRGRGGEGSGRSGGDGA